MESSMKRRILVAILLLAGISTHAKVRLNRLFCDDMILQQAPQAKSREERYAIFEAAETRLMAQMPIIPIYTYTSNHLIHPSVQGMPSNLMDYVNYKYVELDGDKPAAE